MADRFRIRRILALLSLACLSLGMVSSTAAAPSGPSGGETTCEGEMMDVVADGVGTTAKEALSDALRSAVAQVVGMLVVASDQVRNDALIESKVLTYSDGYVKSHVVISPSASRGGLIRLKIKATVCVSKLTKALTSNAIRVRKLDLQSIQGESETLDTRNRSAAEIAAEAFQGFPSALLKAEPLKERRVSGDSDESIVEIPVRVQVDMTRWRAWFQQAKRLLDRIAESRGTENWNTKTPGWHPLRASTAKPRSGSRGGLNPGVEAAICEISRDYWTCRFMPADADRRGASVFVSREEDGLPLILAQKKRVVAILDSMGGRLHWWQLSQDAYDAMIRCIHPPTLAVRIDDPDGNAIGTALTDWSEIVESDKPGQDSVRVIGPEHKLGRPNLLVGNLRHGVGFQCAMTSKRDERGVLLFPCGLMNAREGSGTWDDGNYYSIGNIFTPVVVFPYRFRVPADELPQATAAAVKVTLGPFAADDAGPPPPTAPSDDSGSD